MDLGRLESFLAVARHRSFTQAARELHLTQAGVSRQVQKLERELGVALLERRRGAVVLTAAGARVRAYAEEVLDRHRRLIEDLRPEPATLAGELRIAASTTPGEFLVPDLVAQFTERYPAVQPRIFITDSAGVIEELSERRWDVGFMGMQIPGRGLRYDVIARDEVVLAVPAGHPYAGRGTVRLAELAEQPFLEREGGSGTLLSVRTVLAERGLSLPAYRVVMTLSTTQAIVSAVEHGYGLGWVSSLALESRDARRVALVRLAEIPLDRALYLVQDGRRPLPPVAAAFAEWVCGRSVDPE